MTPGKVAANRGVARNKKPLQNLLYRFEAGKEAGAWAMYWAYERDLNRGGMWSFHGPIHEDEVRKRLTPKQWSKFRQGERSFVRQRRVDGRNVPKPGS